LEWIEPEQKRSKIKPENSSRLRCVRYSSSDENSSQCNPERQKEDKNMKKNEDMSHILQTPDECLLHAKIMEGRGRQDLAAAAYKRAFQLMAVESGVSTAVEREFWTAIHAYEHAKAERLGRKSYKMTRLRPMIKRWGVKETMERSIVIYGGDTTGWRDLNAMGLTDLCFENIVLRHPNEFSAKAVAVAKERLAALVVKPLF
jgi:hypothetical protein